MKNPATNHRLRWLATGVLLASLTTGCIYDATPTVQAQATATAAPVYDFIRIAPTGPPQAPRPTVVPKVAPVVTSRPIAAPRASKSLSGQATWYRWHVGEAAAGPRLRQALGPHWRFKIVKTCLANAPTRCVSVKLSDWCLCSQGNRLIDLDVRSFARLAPTSAGVIAVTVHW